MTIADIDSTGIIIIAVHATEVNPELDGDGVQHTDIPTPRLIGQQ